MKEVKALALHISVLKVFYIYSKKLIDEEIVDEKNNESAANAIKLNSQFSSQVGCGVEISSGINEWYRVCVICEKNLVEVDNEKLDKHLRNEMQAKNIMVLVVVNNELKYTIYCPAFMAGNVWDLGFINAMSGEMMVINVMRSSLPENRLELLTEYINFFGLLTRKTSYRTVFGFQREGKPKFDDTIMEPNIFKRYLSNVMNMEENSPILDSITNGLCDLFGNVSFNALIKLVNMNLSSFSEVDYSKTGGSPKRDSLIKKVDFAFLYSGPVNQNCVTTYAKEPLLNQPIAKAQSNQLQKIGEENKAEQESPKEKKIDIVVTPEKKENSPKVDEEENQDDFGEESDPLGRANEHSQDPSPESNILIKDQNGTQSPEKIEAKN